MDRSILLGCAAFLTFVSVNAPAYAETSKSVCRTTKMPDNSEVVLCKDPDGHWRQVDQAEGPAAVVHGSPNGLPARSEVTYKGSWSATVTAIPRMNLNNLSIRSAINQAMNVRTKNMGGEFNILVTINGSILTGFVWGNGFAREQFDGTFHDGMCQMTGRNMDGADHIEGQCGPSGFSGTLKGQTVDRHGYKASFETSAAQIVDLDQRDREQLAANKAEQARIAAAEAKLRNAPAAGPVLTKKLDGYVRTDAHGWAYNHYDVGSLRNVKVIDGSVKRGVYVLRGEYTFNGGQPGWVLAKMSGANLQCIQFWDAMVGCRDLRTAQQGEATRRAVANAFSDSPSDGEIHSCARDGVPCSGQHRDDSGGIVNDN